MLGRVSSLAGALVGVVLVASGLTVGQAVTASAATTVMADWQLNDPAGSAVMVDGTGRHNGAVSPDAATQGLTLNGSYYDWSLRCPACPPAAQPRVVQVPDSSELEIPDASVTQTIELRFKTPKGYGNI